MFYTLITVARAAEDFPGSGKYQNGHIVFTISWEMIRTDMLMLCVMIRSGWQGSRTGNELPHSKTDRFTNSAMCFNWWCSHRLENRFYIFALKGALPVNLEHTDASHHELHHHQMLRGVLQGSSAPLWLNSSSQVSKCKKNSVIQPPYFNSSIADTLNLLLSQSAIVTLELAGCFSSSSLVTHAAAWGEFFSLRHWLCCCH